MLIQEKDKSGESWEEFVSLGIEAREKKDDSAWILGDIVNQVTTTYGEDTIGEYAYAIGVEKKTLMKYRTVASKFSSEIRAKYKKLSFTHFDELAAIEKPEAWLEKADDEEWSVEMLRKQIHEAYPKVGEPKLDDNPPEVYKCPECGLWRLKDISSFEICRGHYKIVTNKEGKSDYKYY